MFRYFDGHCDTALALQAGADFASNNGHVSLDSAGSIDRYAQFFALFVNMGEGNKPSAQLTERYRQLRDALYAGIAKYSDRIAFCRSTADMDKAWDEGKIAGFMSIEGAEQLYDMTLDRAYADGVRMVTITWNHKNQFGGTNLTGGGITEEGRALVRRAKELGVIVDLSHGSDQLFYDVAEIMDGTPFICSHSNSRAVWNHTRNITDDMFRELIRCGGVTGMNVNIKFVGERPVTVDSVIKHIEHFCSLGGQDNVSMGGDLDGSFEIPQGIDNVGEMYKIAERMAQLGYSDELIDKVFYKNLRRVVRQIVG